MVVVMAGSRRPRRLRCELGPEHVLKEYWLAVRSVRNAVHVRARAPRKGVVAGREAPAPSAPASRQRRAGTEGQVVHARWAFHELEVWKLLVRDCYPR